MPPPSRLAGEQLSYNDVLAHSQFVTALCRAHTYHPELVTDAELLEAKGAEFVAIAELLGCGPSAAAEAKLLDARVTAVEQQLGPAGGPTVHQRLTALEANRSGPAAAAAASSSRQME
jgi:hypothetical protein